MNDIDNGADDFSDRIEDDLDGASAFVAVVHRLNEPDEAVDKLGQDRPESFGQRLFQALPCNLGFVDARGEPSALLDRGLVDRAEILRLLHQLLDRDRALIEERDHLAARSAEQLHGQRGLGRTVRHPLKLVGDGQQTLHVGRAVAGVDPHCLEGLAGGRRMARGRDGAVVHHAQRLAERVHVGAAHRRRAAERLDLRHRHAELGRELLRLFRGRAERLSPVGHAFDREDADIDLGKGLGAHLEGAHRFRALVHLHDHADERVALGFRGSLGAAKGAGHALGGGRALHEPFAHLRRQGRHLAVELGKQRLEVADRPAGLLDRRLDS